MPGRRLNITADDLVQTMQAATELPRLWSMGTIVDIRNGRVQITFEPDGTGTAYYPVLHSYTPVVGDRVLIAEVQHSRVVLGKVS